MAVLTHIAEGDDARLERLRQSEPVRGLSRALRLVEGFGFYIVVCERASDGPTMLDLVRERVMERGDEVRWVHLSLTVAEGDLSEGLERDLLTPLVTPRTEPRGDGEVVVVHAEVMRPADRGVWAGIFNRLNRARNLVVSRLGAPLVLLITRENESLFAESAPDFWSLRSEAWRVEPAPERESGGGEFYDPRAFAEHLREASARVCRIEVGGRSLCTGFLIGPDLVMTVYHGLRSVIEHPEQVSDVVLRFWLEQGAEPIECRLASDWLCDASPPDRGDDSGAAGATSTEELDYAVLRLAVAVGNAPTGDGRIHGWFDLRRVAPGVGGSLAVFQHPHGGPLRFSMNPESVIGFNDSRTRVRHKTNTLRGSAGGPCLDAQWNVVAMHHAGYPWAGFNQAVPMSAIYDLLRARGKLDEIERHARVAPLADRIPRYE